MTTLTTIEQATGTELVATKEWREYIDSIPSFSDTGRTLYRRGDNMRDELLALIMRLVGDRDGLYAEVKMYGDGNGALKDANAELVEQLAAQNKAREKAQADLAKATPAEQARSWAKIDELTKDLAAMTKERDLAVAHDRQPYPTAYAYEKVCEKMHALERDLAAAREEARKWEWVARCMNRMLTNSTDFSQVEAILARYQPAEEEK